MRIALGLAAAVFAAALGAQTCHDVSVDLSATPQAGQITLDWNTDANATGYSVYRRAWGSTNWGSPVANLAGTVQSWTDTAATAGTAYEYAVGKSASSYSGWGFVLSAHELAAVDSRGKLILVVDDSFSTSLATELAQLQDDLVGDGWQVIRHDVSRAASVPSVKALIVADYNADPSNVKAVLLFGHVPVPYSGNLNPDAHPNHQGAWPADCFYGELNGTWTDTSVDTTGNPTQPSRAQNVNVPGDGKYDQSTVPGSVELMVGRVDLANMSTYTQTEEQLLQAWLVKHHEFVTAQWRPQDRAVIDDNFGYFSGEAFAASGWRSFAPLVGAANVAAGDFITTTAASDYLWAYGCGGGSYTSASGVGNTGSFASNTVQVAFTCLFGSYHGDWDSDNNFIRAPLGSGRALTCAWSGRPWWYFHSMGLGEPIGASFLETINDAPLSSYGDSGVHVALMGSPTLRLHYVAPATALSATHTAQNPVDLSWAASTDSVIGYEVYRAADRGGPYTRLTTAAVTSTGYSDTPADGTWWYMVRARLLRQTPSGTYFDLSTGTPTSVTVSGGTSASGPGPGSGSSGGGGGEDGGCSTEADHTGFAMFAALLLLAVAFHRRRLQS